MQERHGISRNPQRNRTAQQWQRRQIFVFIAPRFSDVRSQPSNADEERDVAGRILKHRQQHVGGSDQLNVWHLRFRRRFGCDALTNQFRFGRIDGLMLSRFVAILEPPGGPQTSPATPLATNVIRQPIKSISHGITNSYAAAPILAPE